MRWLANRSNSATQLTRRSRAFPALTLLTAAFFCAASIVCHGQVHPATCHDGSGKYQENFSTGVTISVGAVKNGQLSARACGARLTWDNQELPAVPDAWEVDVDLLGADVGLGAPVVAFKIKKSDIDAQSAYQLYSLKKPPLLLRTVTGGTSYSASDTDMNGLVEIWTDDARAVDGFERISLASLDFAPTVVLRFEDRQLLDVSSQFLSHYDSQIAEVRSHLDAQELSDFRNSTGRLSMNIVLPGDQLHRLMRTKIKVLEIVWSYLYSGREQQAWQELAGMWPAADTDRIHAAILDARTHGILKETDGVSLRPSRWVLKKRKPSYIFEEANESPQEPVNAGLGSLVNVQTQGHHPTNPTADTRPKSILLRRQPPSSDQQALPKSDELVDLVIDVAGKVHSAKSAGSTSKDLLDDAAGWNFIPAFKNGHPVASHLRLQVGYMQ